MGTYAESIICFEKIIDALENDLGSYARRPDAKESYIKGQNNLIKQLTEVFNGLFIPNPDIWVALNNQMETLRKIDPHLGGFRIELIEKQSGHLALIQFNLPEL